MWINSHQWNSWRIAYSCCQPEDLENNDQNDLYSDMLKLPEQPAEGTAPVDLPTQICYGGNKYLLWLIIKLFDSIYYSCFNYSNIWLISIISPQLTYSGSVQSVMSNSLWSHGLQHARLPCPSPTPAVYSNSCPLSRWCHRTISSSVVPFSSWLQSFPASGSFPMSWFFSSGGQSIGASASASVLPMNIQNWFPLGLAG